MLNRQLDTSLNAIVVGTAIAVAALGASDGFRALRSGPETTVTAHVTPMRDMPVIELPPVVITAARSAAPMEVAKSRETAN